MALVPGACAPTAFQFRVLFTADANGLGLSLQPHGAEACPQRLSNTVVSAASGQAERCGVRPGDEVLAIGRLTVSSWVFVQTTNALKCLCFPVELVLGARARGRRPRAGRRRRRAQTPPSAAAVVAVAATAPAAPVPAPAAFDDAARSGLDAISVKLPCGRVARNRFVGKDGVIRRQLTVTDGIIRCYVCEVRVAEGRGKPFAAKDARGNSFDYVDWAKRHAGYYQYEGGSRNLHVEELGRLVAPEALAAPTLAAPTPRGRIRASRGREAEFAPIFSARSSPPSPAAAPGRADATPNAASPASPASPAAPPAASSRTRSATSASRSAPRFAGGREPAPASPSGPAATLAARLVAVDAELRALAATAGSLRRSAEKRKRAAEAAASADLAADLADFECRTLAARGPADALRRREHFWAAECAPRAARATADDAAPWRRACRRPQRRGRGSAGARAARRARERPRPRDARARAVARAVAPGGGLRRQERHGSGRAGRGCGASAAPESCGLYDDSDFRAAARCCACVSAAARNASACGGGVHAPGAGATLEDRRFFDPLPLASGCPALVELEAGTSFYMRLDGFDVAVDGRLPTLLVEWDVAPAPPAVLLFVPGRPLVTLFTGYNVEATSAALTVTKLYSSPAIDADDLATVKRLWADNCAPWLAPPGWSWPVYMNTDYPKEFGERDSRDKPYCDWWPSMTPEGLGAVASCDDVPGVECGADGSVRDLVLNDFGLRGALPADFALPRCEVLLLQNNRLEGPAPDFFFEAEDLEELMVSNNRFVGDLRCPSSPKPARRIFNAERNGLRGPVPTCFLASYPRLQHLRLGANDLGGELRRQAAPPRPRRPRRAQGGLSGPVPWPRGRAGLATLALSHNYLTGPLDSTLLNAFPNLYSFDASYNRLTGPLPTVSCCVPHLRHLVLKNNRFNGSVASAQFDAFAATQTESATSELSIAHNSLSGPLPKILKTFFYGADARLSRIDVSSNNFRCSKAHGNAYFEDWAHFMSQDIGMCAPVPRPRRVRNGKIYPGVDLLIEGADYLATAELACRFTGVANYGDDFSSSATLAKYDDLIVHVTMPPEDDEREVLSRQAMIGLICLGVLVVVLAAVASVLFFCFRKERDAHYDVLRINANQDGMLL
ncbi:hypothetical protein JL721_6126 [Aureococcus anophagefferens]|nr:hypothetical protein JL721_6126 [Aureococcus anophagefferens]